MLSNKLLEQRLNKAGYYQCPTTPGLWRHKLTKTNLRDILLEHYELTQDWSGSRFAGIDLTWDYTNRTCHLSIKKLYQKTPP